MAKKKFISCTIINVSSNKCYDLPKEAPLPREGENVFIHDETIRVTHVNYHINKTSYCISIYGRNE